MSRETAVQDAREKFEARSATRWSKHWAETARLSQNAGSTRRRGLQPRPAPVDPFFSLPVFLAGTPIPDNDRTKGWNRARLEKSPQRTLNQAAEGPPEARILAQWTEHASTR